MCQPYIESATALSDRNFVTKMDKVIGRDEHCTLLSCINVLI